MAVLTCYRFGLDGAMAIKKVRPASGTPRALQSSQRQVRGAGAAAIEPCSTCFTRAGTLADAAVGRSAVAALFRPRRPIALMTCQQGTRQSNNQTLVKPVVELI